MINNVNKYLKDLIKKLVNKVNIWNYVIDQYKLIKKDKNIFKNYFKKSCQQI